MIEPLELVSETPETAGITEDKSEWLGIGAENIVAFLDEAAGFGKNIKYIVEGPLIDFLLENSSGFMLYPTALVSGITISAKNSTFTFQENAIEYFKLLSNTSKIYPFMVILTDEGYTVRYATLEKENESPKINHLLSKRYENLREDLTVLQDEYVKAKEQYIHAELELKNVKAEIVEIEKFFMESGHEF